ncbi:eukaryotic translation elongation factor 1 delta a (guanine nucleotide exchange protein) isoform X2 [Entelurus aequoreus]|uniref:eukaryotic translation elongation factor 1 delta a (guanine nucleotide exchange protein) isoform X2 n=2 Tax=Entelurus aequoreus TaxID=161455 RepID=UPI002B1D7478|nr:eukaryotic translation elongation factor 1 delta a (guanine nucleotide exchange protein) isoform X2 [Entelurus aequoreus]
MDPLGPNDSEQAATTKERSIISGDNLQFGKLRRHARSSQPEKTEDERLSSSVEMSRSPGLQAESVAKPLSSSPRSPNTKHWNVHPKRPQQEGANVPTVKSSGTPHRRYSRGRHRTSSETEKGGRGSREPKARKRSENANMSGLQCLASDKVWFDKQRYDEAEKNFYEGVNGPATKLQSSSHAAGDQELIVRMKSLELENQTLHKVVGDMRAALHKLESRVVQLEKTNIPAAKVAPVQTAPAKKVAVQEDDDDDIDLFGSDEEDEEAARLKQERVEAYTAKKAKKPALIAKSSILLDVKPWDDETDMSKLEECVRSVQVDGLLWGASKLVAVGYGIKKLQINCVVEDDKVGTDILEEEITKFEDLVQSVDVAAFNKI